MKLNVNLARSFYYVKYNLEYCRDLKDNIFISNKIISIRWDIFSTKYGLYKCFQNKEIINNCFLIHPNKKPKNSILDKFKNKKVYMKPQKSFS